MITSAACLTRALLISFHLFILFSSVISICEAVYNTRPSTTRASFACQYSVHILSIHITLSAAGDGRHLLATGVHSPRFNVYDLKELTLKFERFLTWCGTLPAHLLSWSTPVLSVCLVRALLNSVQLLRSVLVCIVTLSLSLSLTVGLFVRIIVCCTAANAAPDTILFLV